MVLSLATSHPKATTTAAASTRRPRSAPRTICAAHKNPDASIKRRDAFLAAGGLLAGSALGTPEASLANLRIELKKENLSGGQINELRQAMQRRAEQNLAKILNYKDNPDALRLVINDAGTYDIATKTGGLDGSIILDEELNRPENVALKPYVAKLKEAKDIIDRESIEAGQGPISWADLMVLGAKVTTQLSWLEVKKKKTGGNEESAVVLSKAFGTDFPVTLGRSDATEPAPAGRIPQPDASVEEIAEFFRLLANKDPTAEPSYLTPKPPFWARPAFVLYTASTADPAAEEERWVAAVPEKFAPWKDKYDKSRKSITRTGYEVDFVDYFTKLTAVGVKKDKLAYLKDLVLDVKT